MAFPLYVTGFVEYTSAGDIMIEAEGEPKNLKQFIAGLCSLDQSWKVSDFFIVETTPKGYSSFVIRNRNYGDGLHAHKSFTTKLLNSFSMRMRRLFGSKKTQDI
jgi:acylphosphatase